MPKDPDHSFWARRRANEVVEGFIFESRISVPHGSPNLVPAMESARIAVAFDAPATEWDEVLERELWFQVCVIRDIFGRPYQGALPTVGWPENVVGLAASLDDGGAHPLILADALDEAGDARLANHFRLTEWHPKGCWALDYLLRKE